jgi:hypothetical protein
MVPAALPIPRSLHVETLLLNEEGLTILASSSEATAVLADEVIGVRDGRIETVRPVLARGKRT